MTAPQTTPPLRPGIPSRRRSGAGPQTGRSLSGPLGPVRGNAGTGHRNPMGGSNAYFVMLHALLVVALLASTWPQR